MDEPDIPDPWLALVAAVLLTLLWLSGACGAEPQFEVTNKVAAAPAFTVENKVSAKPVRVTTVGGRVLELGADGYYREVRGAPAVAPPVQIPFGIPTTAPFATGSSGGSRGAAPPPVVTYTLAPPVTRGGTSISNCPTPGG